MKYVSGRLRKLELGLSSYSENKPTLNVIGISTFNGQIVGAATSNIIPFLYSNFSDLPSAVTYHGAFAHVHGTGKAYYAHAANWYELVNKELNGTVGTGTEKYNIGHIDSTSLNVSGIASASAFADFDYLQAPYGSTVSFTVTVASKSNHRYSGGSSNAYYINGIESPVLTLTPGRTYRFNNNNSGSHPLRFYYDADRTIQYSTGVNFQNTYTEITVSDTTPNVLHYQCVNHPLMGNSVVTNSNVVDSSYAATLRDSLTVSGNITANGNILGDNATNISGINSVTATSFFGDGSGLVNLGIPGISTAGTTELTNLELSGNLKVAGVSTFNNVKLDDNNKIQIGSSQDLELYHNGTASYIDNNTGALYLRNNVDDDDGGNIIIQAKSGKTSAVFQDDEGVRLYYDDAEKIATTGYGVTINGTTETQKLYVTGISTFGDNKVIVGGATTDLLVNGSARVTGELKVGDGTITLNSAGLSTFPTGVDVSGGSGLIASSAKISDLTSGRVVFAGTGGELEDSANLTFNGTSLNGTFTGDGTGLSVAIPGISTAGTTELTNLVVSGLTTLATAKVTDLTDNRIVIAGTGGELEDSSKLTFDGTTLAIVGDATFTGNVSVAGTLTSEDKTNVDSLGIVTARTGVRISSGGLVVSSGVATFTDAIDSNGGANISGGAGLVASTAKVSDLTDGRVVYAGASGELQDSSHLTFNGTTLNGTFSGDGTALLVTIPGISTNTTSEFTNLSVVGVLTAGSAILGSAKVTDLTSGRVVYAGNAGELQDNSTFTFNGSTVTAPAFAGDGSALTGITAGGVGAIGGLTVKDEGVVVGTAGSVSTLDFLGGGVSVIASSGAAGVATVTVSTVQNPDVQTINVSGVSTFAGNINANGNIVGDNSTNITGLAGVTATTLTGTLQTAAQPNVTSLGTLTSLNVSGAIASGGNITIENTSPKLFLTDSDNNSDFSVRNSDGSFIIYDETNSQQRMVLASDGTFDFNGNVDLNNGLDVTSGDLNVAGNAGIGSLNVTGVSTFNSGLFLPDSTTLRIGGSAAGGDLQLYHNGSNTYIDNSTGTLHIRHSSGTGQIQILDSSQGITIQGKTGEDSIKAVPDAQVELYYDDALKLATNTGGITVTGTLSATTFSGSGASLTSITNSNLSGSAGITNANLANSTVSYGGISLSLGGSDATPAFNLTDATNYPTSSLVGTITNAQLAGSIANNKLANSTVSYGGVSLALGETDATPAFNLTDATNYPFTSLTGITTTILGDATPKLGGDLNGNGKSIFNVGIITATLFDGPSQIGIQSGGTQIGVGITQLNFVGTGNTFAVNGTTVDVSIAGGSGGSGGGGGDKFNTTITNSVQATVYGYESDIISFPSDNTKRYVIESISLGNVTAGVGSTVNVIASINPGVTTYSSEYKVYLAYNVPVPDNGLVELLKEPMVVNPSDVIKVWATDETNTGINGAIELYASYTEHESTDYIAGYGSTTNITTTGIATVYTSTSDPTVIQSIKATNRTDTGDFPITIQIVNGSTVTHLAKNLVIPRYASVELLDRPKRIEAGAEIRMQQAAAANTIDVIVSGKKITS